MTIRRFETLALLVCVTLAMLLGAPAFSAEDEEKKPPPPSIDEFTAKMINEAIVLLNEEDHAGAKEKLGRLKVDRLSPYERSRVEQIFASIEAAQDHYPAALKHFQEAIRAGGLNELETSQVTYNIAQLYAAEEMWQEAIDTLESWFATATNPNSAAYYLLALAYYQQGDLDGALKPAQKAVDLAEKPQSGWLQLLLALRLQRQEYPEARSLLEQLIALDPSNKSYWVQLSSVYGQLEDYPGSLAVLQVAQAGGLLTEDTEVRRLADLLAMNDVPHRCARLLEEAMAGERVDKDVEIYEKLANCWIAAGEFDAAVEPLERAANLSEDGKLFIRLGEVHVQDENWAAAAEALENGIERGGLDDPEHATVLTGIALFKQGAPQRALPWFRKAADSEKHGELARSYIRLIESSAAEPLVAEESR